ncbi:hypothetical protein AB0F72_33825 [Actinoplanes sp. NPDC023936]|uniref:hypothetical protein n=1 Tax=Actinoplanes sp. NPDC023936 TaxID=3154910 RepID=UPI0033E8B23E
MRLFGSRQEAPETGRITAQLQAASGGLTPGRTTDADTEMVGKVYRTRQAI